MKVIKKSFINCCLILSSIVVTCLVFEFSYRLVDGSDLWGQIISENLYDTLFDPDLGYILKANHAYTARKKVRFPNENISEIYSVTYSFDALHRRTVKTPELPDAPHILIFGGSFAYGEGLQDEDTLQYQLKSHYSSANIYSYAMHGSGTAKMLRVMEAKELSAEVSSKKGAGLYFFSWFHVDRNVGSAKAYWTMMSPHYHFDDNGQFMYQGLFYQRHPFITKFNTGIHWLVEHSKVMKKINLNWDALFVDKYRHTAELILAAKEQYEKTFDGKFFVINHPLAHAILPASDVGEISAMFDFLARNGVEIINLHLNIDKSKDAIPYDGHPTGELNGRLAASLGELALFK